MQPVRIRAVPGGWSCMLGSSMRRSPLRSHIAASAAVLMALAAPGNARTAHAQASRAQEGEAAFQRGLAAMQSGHPEEAVTAFEAAYDANPVPVVLFNLGVANAALGRPHPAVVAFEKYLDAADPKADASNIAAVRAELERLRRESCVIVPTLSPVNAVVTADGRAADPWHGQILLAPGPRELAVRADGYKTHTQRVDAVPGRFLIEIALTPETIAAPAPALAPIPVPSVDSARAPAPAAPTPPPATAQPTAPPPAPEAQPAPAPLPTEPEPRGAEEPPGEPAPTVEAMCATGDWCLGPVLILGIPDLIGPGFLIRNEHFGFGLDFQITPTLTLDNSALGLSMLSGTVRVFPFGGAFFLGAGFALYHASGSATGGDPATGETIKGEGAVTFPGLLMGLGLMGRNGFVFGIDFAAIIPLASTNIDFHIVSGNPNSDTAMSVKKTATDTVNKALATLPFVPQLNLLRLGYLF